MLDRSGILAVVMKHVRANVHLPEGTAIDPARSLVEQGVSSLDAVEIAYGAMRELGLRVSPAETTRLRSVDQLVDLIHRRTGGSEPR
jgi:acyl carrier protein